MCIRDSIEAFVFRIGSATPIYIIEELIDKKLKNTEVAEIREIKKIYMKKVGEKIYSKEIILDEASQKNKEIIKGLNVINLASLTVSLSFLTWKRNNFN